MLFTVLPTHSHPPEDTKNRAFLVRDNWDDWAKFKTMFSLYVSDRTGTLHDIGSVKIGEKGLRGAGIVEKGCRSPDLEETFKALGDKYFSVGQSDTYYEALNRLADNLGLVVLKALKDCAYDIDIFNRAEYEEVMGESLLRSVSKQNVLNRFHRLARGDAKLTEFQFEYRLASLDPNLLAPVISFHVKPNSEPPTNIHVLIGRNGVGKTKCLQSMASAICRGDDSAEEFGSFLRLGDNKDEWSFAGLIVVSFSAFDSFELPQPKVRGLRATMVGLRHKNESEIDSTNKSADRGLLTVKTPDELANDFCNSFAKCRSGLRRERWLSAVITLGNDPLFAEAGIGELLDLQDEEWRQPTRTLFGQLSSGHAVVLLAITQLVEHVDERTFVLLDEPEGHLHPPLLSTFIRAISDLLIGRNGVALIATHSPVVLQEVPRSCVWVLQRSGNSCVAERPSIETFGENVGHLTGSVFGLEVTNSGFHQLLRQAIENGNLTYEMVLNHFNQQLGAEARALARSLVVNSNPAQGEEQ